MKSDHDQKMWEERTWDAIRHLSRAVSALDSAGDHKARVSLLRNQLEQLERLFNN